MMKIFKKIKELEIRVKRLTELEQLAESNEKMIQYLSREVQQIKKDLEPPKTF